MFSSKSTLWLVGDWTHPDFAAPLRWLSEHAVCSHHALAPANDTPTAIVFAQSRPGQFGRRDVERLHADAPLAPLYVLTGPWCEGELRSGHPLPGLIRIPWRRWRPAFETELADLATAGPVPAERSLASYPRARHPLPRTASDTDRIQQSTQLLRNPKLPSANALIYTHSRVTNDALADALNRFGVSAEWHESAPASPESPNLRVYDGWDHVPAPTESTPPTPAPRRLLLLHFPRPSDILTAQHAGIQEVLALPLLLRDLGDTLHRLLG